MKKILYSVMAAALVLAASCTKEPAEKNEAPFFSNEGGWVNLKLNLPSTNQTKANDVFSDGENFEYSIENARLVVFAGSMESPDEDACTLRSAYELKSGDWNMVGTSIDQITATRNITQRVISKNVNSDEFVYALIILNDHFFNVNNSKKDGIKDVTTLYYGGEELTYTTFADFKTFLLDESDKDFSNIAFTMTNMPHIHKVGGAIQNAPEIRRPWSLVRFDTNRIYASEGEATAGQPGAEIDVERVVAKVTVNIASGVNKLESDNSVALETLGWFIDNTNPKAFVIRNVEDPVAAGAPYKYLTYNVNGFFRMASATAVHTHDVYEGSQTSATYPVVRTYWGIDPNYDSDATNLISEAGKMVDNSLMEFNANHVNVGGRLRPAGTSYYCAENTFDVTHMLVKNTTRVILAAKFNGGNDFYTLTSEPNEIMDYATTVKHIKSTILGRVNIINWLDEYIKADATEEQKLALFNVTITNTKVGEAFTGKAVATITLGYDSAITAILKSGKTLENAKAKYNVIAADQTAYINGNINNQLNYYKDGVAYYQALIRHFDDNETPWTADEKMTNNTESIYGNDENAYLGRYGVLRNNWYDINVTAIRQIGSPVVPELTDEPDDVVEQFIKVKINIMPWAKRSQNVIL